MDLRDVFVRVVRSGENVASQAETLRAFGSDRAARVIDVRPERGELVLERIKPGTTLARIADEDGALRVVADLFAKGWPPRPDAPTALATVEHFARSLMTGDAKCARPARVLSERLGDHVQPAVLHGDLHYGNILSSSRAGYVLIDPQRCHRRSGVRHSGYLVSRYAPSATDTLPPTRTIQRRLAVLPDALKLDRHRIAAYAYVAAVLSMMWAVEEREAHAPSAFAEVARLLEHSL